MSNPSPLEGVVIETTPARWYGSVTWMARTSSRLRLETATGRVFSNAGDGQVPQFTEEEVKVVVETAKDYGFAVATRAHRAEGMKRAIRAGGADHRT